MTWLFPLGSPFTGPSVNFLWSDDKAEREVSRSKPGRGERSAEHAQRGRGQELCRPKTLQAISSKGLYASKRRQTFSEHLLIYKALVWHLGRREDAKCYQKQVQACKNVAEWAVNKEMKKHRAYPEIMNSQVWSQRKWRCIKADKTRSRG